jgi:hypothetical protein
MDRRARARTQTPHRGPAPRTSPFLRASAGLSAGQLQLPGIHALQHARGKETRAAAHTPTPAPAAARQPFAPSPREPARPLSHPLQAAAQLGISAVTAGPFALIGLIVISLGLAAAITSTVAGALYASASAVGLYVAIAVRGHGL